MRANSAASPRLVEPETERETNPVLIQDVTAWLSQLIRTLKTCRLYDQANPTVVRFREELDQSLRDLLSRTGSLRLEISSSTLSFAGHEVQVARSRDDNLAAVLYRDGIRQISLDPAIEAREVDILLDQILWVTGPASGDDDLVTLLWDADLPHVRLETAPFEGEADGGSEGDVAVETAGAWPKQPSGELTLVPPAGGESRSDDWRTEEGPADLDLAFDELESIALAEIARFNQEQEITAAQPPVTGILRVLADCQASELRDEDRHELAVFAPRLLHEALSVGDWDGAGNALRLTRSCDPSWSVTGFAAGLCGPHAITTQKVVTALDRDPKSVESFLILARELGPAVAEWLMYALSYSQQAQVRLPLTRVIAELSDGNPERVVRWLGDERWYVVRNVVHILGWIGGNGIVSHLRAAAVHPEPRVRREVIAVLAQVDPEASRPILNRMLDAADPMLWQRLVAQLALDPHPAVTERLLGLLSDEAFEQRPADESRALFRALATRGNAVVPALEALLNRGGLLSRRPKPDRPGIALCIARIGTDEARAVLERGLRSRDASVRKACDIATATWGSQGHD